MARRIFVAGFEPYAIGPLSGALRRAGYEVEHCYEGAEIVERASSFRADILVMSALMPTTDVFAVETELCGQSGLSDLAIVALSGRLASGELPTFTHESPLIPSARVVLWATKPFENDALIAELRRIGLAP